ncbi:MAG: malate synthase G [Dehalococcoidia bacterium]|nr:malate synthase G [Dehalococcoidia bacterium]
MSEEYIKKGSLSVSTDLEKFLATEVLPGLDLSEDDFWMSLENIVDEFSPRNKKLLEIRESIQREIDAWHLANQNQEQNLNVYKDFLKDIGYLVDEGENFHISTQNVDPEIASIAGPQLVVPIMNARFALNAANARWGSLYDALYGSDMIPNDQDIAKVGAYNPVRGEKVVAFAKKFLDENFALKGAKFSDVISFAVEGGGLQVVLSNGEVTTLSSSTQFQGFQGSTEQPLCILLKNNNLHVEIQIDPTHPVGSTDPAGIKDVLLEAAITTIQDCEDSVAAVDGEDKVTAYRNWLGLMKGDLKATFIKNGKEITRALNSNRDYVSTDGSAFSLTGRSLMLVRNVGHLMTNPAILDSNGNEVPEGVLDAMFTICIAIHDLKRNGVLKNSKAGSIYIVKPKMHGPDEVQFTCDLFSAVEKALNLDQLTVKVGIMDEERRTTVNLKECIRVAKDRVIFINTGFLDRTGDEIHTSMEAGPMIPKSQMRQQPWILAYENWNVDSGLEAGFRGNAQIGKGMWAMPDEMLGMYTSKRTHPESGANCAWVPSPTAATIHAMHYHQISVSDIQQDLMTRPKVSIDAILTIPVMSDPASLSSEDIQKELDNNAQGILGYVVRWVDQGIGCSKVPDINNVGLMEDRATCRISSQHIANWLHHSICTKDQIVETMKRMAVVVDQQNSSDPLYKPMAPSYDGFAFQAACNLAIQGRVQPSGYTEPLLHAMRLKFKAKPK